MRVLWAVPIIASILILGTLGLSQNASAENHPIDFALPGNDPEGQELFCIPIGNFIVPCNIDYTVNVINTSDGTYS